MAESRVEYCTKRLAYLEDRRKPWETAWDKAAEMCAVNSKIYIKDVRARIVPKNFDSTGRNALTCFSAAMKSVLVPSNSKWHGLAPENPRLEQSYKSKSYVEYMNNMLFKVRYSPSSNFSSEADLHLNQLGIYGVSPWFVDEEIGKGIFYKAIPMAEMYCDANKKGRIDVNYRVYEITLRQAIKEFGARATSKMKEKFDKTPDAKVRLLHVVEPREDRNPKRKDYTGMAFVSYHVNLDDNELIYESGYRTQPYMTPHYLGIPGEIYGDSPALQAACDMLTINEMAKTTLRAGQRQVDPPLLTVEGLVNASRAGTAGAIISGAVDSQGKPKIIPMQYAGNLPLTLEMQNQVRQVIETAFLKPFFLSLTNDKNMTAEEARLRDAEKSMLLAPMGERIANEWLNGMIEREIDILSQYGYFDDVPDELYYNGALEIKYQSPLVKMQESGAIMAIYKTIEAGLAIGQNDPAIFDMINFPKAFEHIANYNGSPTDILLPPEVAAQKGEMRVQREQAQMMLDAAPVLSQSMKNLGVTGGDNV